jgi:hypothetical protein
MPSFLCCALHPELSDATYGSAVRIVGKWKSKELEFQKEYLKLVGAEPTWIMPNDMKKLIRELPRYRNPIVVLFKRISDECMTARPDPAIHDPFKSSHKI